MKSKDPDQLGLFATQPKIRMVEYLLLLSPSDEIKKEIIRMKQRLHQLIGLSEKNLASIPHIPLFDSTYKEDDAFVRESLNQTFNPQIPFLIQITGVGTVVNWDKSKSLVLQINSPEQIMALSHLAGTALGLKVKSSNPHFTIAKDIPPTDFAKLKSLEEFDTTGEFLCRGITVLKKIHPDNEKEKYAKIHEVVFKGQ